MALDRQLQIRDDAARREAHFLRQAGGVERREALRAWRTEAAQLLGSTFTHWAADPARRQRQIGQCIAELEVLARHLFDRGWLLKHETLLSMAREAITPVAAAQAAGKIGDFYPYFRAAIRRYVPVNADEIQHTARREGAQPAGDLMAALSGLLTARQASPVEAIGERHAERMHESSKPAARRGRPRKDTGAGTLDLFSSSP